MRKCETLQTHTMQFSPKETDPSFRAAECFSMDFVAVFDVLVSYCVCFEKPWEKNPTKSLKIMCWVFYLRIPAFYKQTEYEKAQTRL